jgi:hypothetical protein
MGWVSAANTNPSPNPTDVITINRDFMNTKPLQGSIDETLTDLIKDYGIVNVLKSIAGLTYDAHSDYYKRACIGYLPGESPYCKDLGDWETLQHELEKSTEYAEKVEKNYIL